MNQIFKLTVVVALVAMCAGCGVAIKGSGAGTGGGSGGVDVPPGQSSTLGSRAVPGGTVTVTSVGAITLGAMNTFHIALDGGLVPSQVTVWITTEAQPTDPGIQATLNQTKSGEYDVSLSLPSSIAAGSHVWVRLSFADGSVVETGAEDFPLVQSL